MIVPLYATGEWFAVVTDGSVAVLPPTTEAGVVTEIWASLRDGGGLTEQVQVLLRGGIAAAPPFALVSVEGGTVRAIVRGDLEIAVRTDAGTRVLGAAHVSTWTEEMVPGAQSVAVRTPGWTEPDELQDASVDGELPVLSAVVRAAGVRIGLVATSADADGPAEPQPAAERPKAPAGTPRPEPAAKRAPEPEPAAQQDPEPVPAVAGGEDHDGLTVLSSDVVALRRQLPEWAGDAVPGPLAVPAAQAAPPAKLLMSSGLVVSLNRPVLLGRAPQVSRVANRQIPRLVTVASPNQDISRTHAEVRMEGEDVVVIDLRSTNGILLLRQNAGPQRLHPNEPTVVEPGVVVDLGEGVTFTVERGA